MKRPREPSIWTTRITRVEPDIIEIAGVPLQEIIGRKGLPDVVPLLLSGEFADPHSTASLTRMAWEASGKPLPNLWKHPGERISRQVARFLLSDVPLPSSPVPKRPDQVLFCVGRVVRCLAFLLNREDALKDADPDEPFSGLLARALTGRPDVSPSRARMLEALAVATVDHGVTAPSAQAVRLAASVRAPLECALASGMGTITRIHGGAGLEAAELFLQAARGARASGKEPTEVLEDLMTDRVRAGNKIPGLGHRIHDVDPRVLSLWALSEETGTAADCVHCSQVASEIFFRIAGISLPMNVDGVIGAVIADMGLPPELAEGVFLLGRMAGLAAHYFEEVSVFPEMRWITFSEARYAGAPSRSLV